MLESWQIVMIVVAAVFSAIILAVLVTDVCYVFYMIRSYHRPQADPVKVAAYRKKMEDAYFDRDEEVHRQENPFRHHVTDEEFEANVVEFEKAMDEKGASSLNSIFASLDESYTKLLRESIGVVIAPRAVLFQVAHPYVAVGISQHSNIVRDTPKRFQKTYFHMFRMAFGTRREAIASAKVLRRVHNRVQGTFKNDESSVMKKGHMYSAGHTHALLWVGLALAESVTMGYAMMVKPFSTQELEELARDAAYGMMLFGVPKKLATGTYEDFRIAIEACWSSDVITVGPEAQTIAQHLLYPTKWYLTPVFAVARYITMVIMPEKFQVAFFGRRSNICDQIVAAVSLGVLRFLYRFIPGPLRYIPEYSQAVRRNGKRTTCAPCDPFARVGEKLFNGFKDVFISIVLPEVRQSVPERTTDHVDTTGVLVVMPELEASLGKE